MSIEEDMFPGNGKIVINNGEVTALILDEEIDPIECLFNNDDCVQLNTKDYEYITLSVDNLEDLIRLIGEAGEAYEEINS
jgi:hypothetical protein